MKRGAWLWLSRLALMGCCLWQLWACWGAFRGADIPAGGTLLPVDGSRPDTMQGKEQPVYMALTFDDGPGRYTEKLLDGLAVRNVRATFFLIGKQIGEQEALVRRMAEEGHQIGNHSYDHANLSAMDDEAVLEDIAQCDAVLQTLLGEDTYWVRPPYGNISREVLAAVPAPLVTWSVDTEDWKSKNETSVMDIIYRDSFDGCVILLHDQYRSTVTAVLAAIDHLQQQDVRFVTLEELFAVRGVEPECGKLYKKVPKA